MPSYAEPPWEPLFPPKLCTWIGLNPNTIGDREQDIGVTWSAGFTPANSRDKLKSSNTLVGTSSV